jgi:predicted transcriptional regulator
LFSQTLIVYSSLFYANFVKSPISWATEEFSKIRLKDKRLNQRCKKVAVALEQQSTEPINQACEDWADTKAAYRFF